jgi:hypothetical protein
MLEERAQIVRVVEVVAVEEKETTLEVGCGLGEGVRRSARGALLDVADRDPAPAVAEVVADHVRAVTDHEDHFLDQPDELLKLTLKERFEEEREEWLGPGGRER